jgi:hypothetical protein
MTPNGPSNIGTSLAGQQFIACETGTITSVKVNTSGGDIELYLVKGDGTAIDYAQPYQKFMGQNAGLVELTLNQPFSVEHNQKYALAIGNVANVIFDMNPVGPPANNALPDGQFSFEFTNTGNLNLVTASDLVFAVNIRSLTIIPTLSQWSLIILCLLIINIGLFKLKQLKLFGKKA